MPKALLAALFCTVVFLSGCARTPSRPAPDLKFTAVDGTKVDLSQMHGKVVLIDFWATWCPPCLTISPDILGLYKKYHSQGLEIIGISVDSDKQAMLDFVKKEGAPWPQYFDDKGDNALVDKLGVDSFPTLWLVGRDGTLVNPNFRELWSILGGGIPAKTSDETLKKIDAAIEEQLKAP
jgi:thiol-disulfide isomerase/thioredoxin